VKYFKGAGCIPGFHMGQNPNTIGAPQHKLWQCKGKWQILASPVITPAMHAGFSRLLAML
jgi:hypothetical protein